MTFLVSSTTIGNCKERTHTNSSHTIKKSDSLSELIYLYLKQRTIKTIFRVNLIRARLCSIDTFALAH